MSSYSRCSLTQIISFLILKIRSRIITHPLSYPLLNHDSSHMNEHTRKLLDDATNEKVTEFLSDLEYYPIDINDSDV